MTGTERTYGVAGRTAAGLFALLLAICLLGGCSSGSEETKTTTAPAAGPDTEYQAIVSELERASKCVTDVEIEPRFAPLRAKTPTRSPIEAKFLTDDKKATAAEAALILDFVGGMAACRPFFGEMTARVHQNIARLIIDTWDRQQKLYGDLRAGSISWGLFNQGSRSNSDRMSGAMEALRMTDLNPTGP